MSLTDKKVAILVHDYFEEAEFTQPLQALKDAGVAVSVISASSLTLHGLNHVEPGNTFQADLLLSDAAAADYDALVLPGGAVNADQLRMEPAARNWVLDYMSAGKPVAAICHAPWLLVSSGVLRGKRLTSYYTIQDDLKNAGATYVDEAVVIDNNLITSRDPDDLPAFCAALLSALA